jgi:hypothetical protein
METVTHNVRDLNQSERTAVEQLVGHGLRENQQLIIQVVNIDVPAPDQVRPIQSLDDWTRIYEGLSEGQINELDQAIKTRANLTRDLP